MKADRPITVNRARSREPLGGEWGPLDPVTQGRVQILPAGNDSITQAQLVVQELKRMASLDPEWDWSSCAVISRNWGQLDPVRALCQMEEIPVAGFPRGLHGHLAAPGNPGTAQLVSEPRESAEGRPPAAVGSGAALRSLERAPRGGAGELSARDQQ